MSKNVMRRSALAGCVLAAVSSCFGLVSAASAARPVIRAVGPAAWPAYLDGPSHTSDNKSQVSITPANVGALVQKWHFVGDPATMPGQPAPSYNASPTVADGAVFIASRTGWFYKLGERTGKVLAKVFIGFQPHLTCTPGGPIATATVAKDPADGQDTVYVGAPDGYLYALRASNLSRKWRSKIAIPSTTVSDYFQWSSPTVANSRIYIGVSSHCDNPLVRGGVIGYNQATGKIFARYFAVPTGVTGGSVWSSVAATTHYVFVTTGNGEPTATKAYDTESIVELRARTLTRVAAFRPTSQLGFDNDFGASPALFGSMVGACNKNGLFYALHVPSMTLAWERRIATRPGGTQRPTCIAASAYDGKHLYVAAQATVFNGTAFQGSVRELNPATGRVLWQTGLPDGVLGTPSLDGAGVLAVGTDGETAGAHNAVYLLNASTGHIVRTLITGGHDFAQSTFAGGWLFTANDTGVYAWGR